MSQQYDWDFSDFLRKFEEKYIPVPECGCWLWLGASGRYGGMFQRGRHMDAHRLSWIFHRGRIPENMRVCHKCDTPLCVNPSHLFLGTAKQNTRDMIAKGRHKYSTTKAPRGDSHWTRRSSSND